MAERLEKRIDHQSDQQHAGSVPEIRFLDTVAFPTDRGPTANRNRRCRRFHGIWMSGAAALGLAVAIIANRTRVNAWTNRELLGLART
jgi:hypothetical protein